MIKIIQSMIEIQAEIKHAKINARNSHFGSEYATLESVLNEVRPHLKKHKLCLIQGVEKDQTGACVLSSKLYNHDGEKIEFNSPLLLSKNDMQGLGSAITYMRRYAIEALFLIGEESDDDAHLASIKPPKTNPPHIVRKASPESVLSQTQTTATPPKTLNLDFVLTFGKYTGKSIKDIGPKVAKDYAEWLKTSCKESGRDLSDQVKAFCEIAEAL